MTRLFLDTNTKRQRFHGIEDSRDDCNGISCYIRITCCVLFVTFVHKKNRPIVYVWVEKSYSAHNSASSATLRENS